MLILQLVESGEAKLVRSIFHTLENSKNPSRERKEWVSACLDLARHSAPVTNEMKRRAHALVNAGLTPLDAAHAAAAEEASVDFFVTSDDQLARKYRGALRVLTPPELILILTKEQP
jgi:predicted nucleic acid-binding protein